MGLLAAIAAPAPLVPIVMLTTALGWLVVVGFLFVYRRTISVILTEFADWFGGFGISVKGFGAHPFGPVASAIRAADNAVIEALENWQRGAEILLNAFMEGISDTFDWMGQEIAQLAEGTARAVDVIVRQEIPDAIRDYIRDSRRRVNALAGRVSEVTAVALPGIRTDVGALGGRVKTWERDLKRLGSRVRANEKKLAAGAFAAAVMVALRSMKLGWLRCGGLRKAGKRICAMNPRVLDALLLGTMFIPLTPSIERLAREMLAFEEEFALSVLHGFRELRDL